MIKIKVIILAGGWGTRLGKMTEIIPKPMVQIGNKPILWHIMKIYSHYGFNDFIICLGYKGEVIKNFFYHYEMLTKDFTINLSDNNIEYHNMIFENWKVTLVDTGLNTLKGARVKKVEKFLKDDINMLTYGDGLADINIPKLIEFHKAHGKMITISGVHKPSRFGELYIKDGDLISFIEKPKSSRAIINGGFIVFNKKLLNYLTTDEDCDLEVGCLEKLTSKGEVMVYNHEGNWECMDHERDAIYLNELWDTKKAFWKVWE